MLIRSAGLVASVASIAAVAAGPAAAQTAPVAQGRTITVYGSAATKTPESLSSAGQLAAYDSALGLAEDAARAKATAVATHLGGSVASVQSLTELTDFAFGYCGYSFPDGGGETGVGSVNPINGDNGFRRRKKPHRKAHKAASSATCKVGAMVVVSYVIN